MPINVLTSDATRAADRTHVWFNVVLGLLVAASIPSQRGWWWHDPMFTVARSIPHSQAVWAWSLLVAVTVYAVGSFMPYGHEHRGAVIIAGAGLCFLWYLAFTLALSRQTYVDPAHSAGLWPLLLFFLALLYGHRAVLYAGVFTGARWGTHPFQMYPITFLMLVSISQVVIGVSPATVQAKLEPGAVLAIAGANLIGGVVTMIGLHLKDVEQGLWLEVCGYASLTLTLIVYITLASRQVNAPVATIGLALSEGFLFASFHRALQIILYKWALYRRQQVRADRYRALLTGTSIGALPRQERHLG
jgi:hypothetical protein